MLEQIKAFFVNHSIKVFAAICGFLIWFGVISREEARTEIELPLRIVNLQSDMALEKPLPEQLLVQLEGKAISLINLKLNRLARVEVNFKGVPIGYNNSIPMWRLNFVSPNIADVKMLRVRQMISYTLGSRIVRKVPVQSNVVASAANDFVLTTEPKIMPDSILISGARNVVDNIKFIPTKEVALSNLKWNNSFAVDLDLSSIPSIVDIADTAVFALVHVEPMDHKVFDDIPVRLIGNFDRSVHSLSPARASVEVSGGKDLVAKIASQDINLYVEFSRFAIEHAEELSPTVHIPYSVANWQITPAKFRLVNIEAQGDDAE